MENSDHNELKRQLLSLTPGDDEGVARLSLDVFKYQAATCEPYRKWIQSLPAAIPTSYLDIPKLHISAFKVEQVVSRQGTPEITFTSSGTSGTTSSRHHVFDTEAYLDNTLRGFQTFYPPIKDTCIVGLLPSYLERSGSSLVAMVDHFVQVSAYEESGTYLYDHERLYSVLMECRRRQIRTLLIGVSFGLLDFAEKYTVDFPELVVMETGGMKGRREEMSRDSLHSLLLQSFGVDRIHSEYGMTELLSQAYSKGDGVFHCGPTMRIVITDINDPLSPVSQGTAGIINIVDLANIDSCSFIMTEDIGRQFSDGSFEVLGRLDQSDIRGCNLMVTDLL